MWFRRRDRRRRTAPRRRGSRVLTTVLASPPVAELIALAAPPPPPAPGKQVCLQGFGSPPRPPFPPVEVAVAEAGPFVFDAVAVNWPPRRSARACRVIIAASATKATVAPGRRGGVRRVA